MVPSAYWTRVRYLFSLGLWGVWRKRHRFVLTNQRVILTEGIMTKEERAVPLSRVQDVALQRSRFHGSSVALSTAGGSLGEEIIGPLTRAGAMAFADALQMRIGKSSDGV